MVTEELLFTAQAPQSLRAGMRLRAGRVLDCVGGGSTGFVYRVHDETLGPIAVREFFPPALAMRVDGRVLARDGCETAFAEGLKLFEEDGWQLAAQDHPGLLKVQQVWSERGTSYLSMPWCDGRTLGHSLRIAPEPPGQAQLSQWMRAMADALTVVHRRRGLHGHLSPDQVMLLDSGRLLVMEFARARRVVAWDPRDVERDPYAAIECSNDPRSGPVGPWTDIYSLAAMLHLALRGRPPQAAVRRAAFDAQEPLVQLAGSGYTEEFLSGIDSGLVLRARARPQSLQAFLARLGLHERRSRQRAIGESLLSNLPVGDAEAVPTVLGDAAASTTLKERGVSGASGAEASTEPPESDTETGAAGDGAAVPSPAAPDGKADAEPAVSTAAAPVEADPAARIREDLAPEDAVPADTQRTPESMSHPPTEAASVDADQRATAVPLQPSAVPEEAVNNFDGDVEDVTHRAAASAPAAPRTAAARSLAWTVGIATFAVLGVIGWWIGDDSGALDLRLPSRDIETIYQGVVPPAPVGQAPPSAGPAPAAPPEVVPAQEAASPRATEASASEPLSVDGRGTDEAPAAVAVPAAAAPEAASASAPLESPQRAPATTAATPPVQAPASVATVPGAVVPDARTADGPRTSAGEAAVPRPTAAAPAKPVVTRPAVSAPPAAIVPPDADAAEAAGASLLSPRCPELLARQYTGRPLDAREREQVRTQCLK